MKQNRTKTYFLPVLIFLAVVGLGIHGWLSGQEPVDDTVWQAPVLATAELSATPAPGWWEDILPRPTVPTMPGRVGITPTGTATSTSTPTPTPLEVP